MQIIHLQREYTNIDKVWEGLTLEGSNPEATIDKKKGHQICS